MNAPPPIRELLESHGLWARKSLGQHFLLDLNITRRIARVAGDLSGQPVIEVGPGPGGLTRALIEAGASPIIAIEKDARFLPLLEPLVEWSEGRLRIVHGDALAMDGDELIARFAPPFTGELSPQATEGAQQTPTSDVERAAPPQSALRADSSPASAGAKRSISAHIVSNLPYNVGTPLLVKWLKAGAWRGPMTLMFQKEVAERICAKPGADAYGRLAVLAQARCHAEIAFTVPARAFTPAPKVDSAVVRLVDRADPYPHLDAIERVTAAAFGQRRKTLRAALRTLTKDTDALLAAAGLAPGARAEQIDGAGFRALAEAWRAS